MQDPIVGGFSKEKIALRRAIAMAYNVDEEITVVRKGQAVEAQISDSARRRRPRPELSQRRIQLRPGARQRAARPLRLQEGRRRLAQAARRQAARRSAMRRRPTTRDRAARRAVEEVARRDRRPHGSPQGQVPRAAQAREAMQADDARARRGSPTIRTATTSCSCSTARTPARATTPATSPGVRQALRAVAPAARLRPSATSCTTRWRGMIEVVRAVAPRTTAATATC